MITVEDIIITKSNQTRTFQKTTTLSSGISHSHMDEDSEILIGERARGTKLKDIYNSKKSRFVNETQRMGTLKEMNMQQPST